MGLPGDFFAMFAQVFCENIKTPEQLIELFEEAGTKPRHIATSLNQDIKEMLQHDPFYDPREDLEFYIPYLSSHGFVYDAGMKRFREANPSPTY